MSRKYRGLLIHDFHCKKSEDFHFKELTESVKHFKETEKGCEIMSDSVEKFAKDMAKQAKEQETLRLVKNLMCNMKYTLDQAMDVLGIYGSERALLSDMIRE